MLNLFDDCLGVRCSGEYSVLASPFIDGDVAETR